MTSKVKFRLFNLNCFSIPEFQSLLDALDKSRRQKEVLKQNEADLRATLSSWESMNLKDLIPDGVDSLQSFLETFQEKMILCEDSTEGFLNF